MAELNNILNSLKDVGGNGLQKTAADQTPPAEKVSAAEQDLVNALNTALTSAEEKTASADGNNVDTSATNELLKIAGDLAGADREGLMKEAHLFGGAFADGCMERLAQYDAAILTDGEKTASAENGVTHEEFEKWAQENPQEFQQYFNEGYKEAAAELEKVQKAELEKMASTPEGREKLAAFEQSYNGTVEELTKLAGTDAGQQKLADFSHGYADTVAQLQKIASEPDGQEKIAALRAGFTHGSQMAEKLASDFYSRGYNDTAELLKSM